MATITLTRADTGIELDFTAKDKYGDAIDLTSATVKFQLYNSDCNLVLDGSCVISDAANGLCNYTIVGSDIDLPYGTYIGTLKITYTPSKTITSSQFEIKIINPCGCE